MPVTCCKCAQEARGSAVETVVETENISLELPCCEHTHFFDFSLRLFFRFKCDLYRTYVARPEKRTRFTVPGMY